jgi:hypothetical protein
VTQEVKETSEVQRTEEEIQAELKRLKAAQAKRSSSSSSTAMGGNKPGQGPSSPASKKAKAKALPKQASIMGFFKK